MSRMSDLHLEMVADIGEDATDEEIDQWYDDWCRQNLFPPITEDEDSK